MSGQGLEPSLKPRWNISQRDAIGTTFLGLLIGLAYAEAVGPVERSIQAKGFTLSTSLLFVMFFVISLNTFIGSYIGFAVVDGIIWFGFFVIASVESVILIFMASLTSVEANQGVRFTFVNGLVIYYIAKLIALFISAAASFPFLRAMWAESEDRGERFAVIAMGAIGLLGGVTSLLVALQLVAALSLRSSNFSTSWIFYLLVAFEVITFVIGGITLSRNSGLFSEE
jgi:hypothetical protein